MGKKKTSNFEACANLCRNYLKSLGLYSFYLIRATITNIQLIQLAIENWKMEVSSLISIYRIQKINQVSYSLWWLMIKLN